MLFDVKALSLLLAVKRPESLNAQRSSAQLLPMLTAWQAPSQKIIHIIKGWVLKLASFYLNEQQESAQDIIGS